MPGVSFAFSPGAGDDKNGTVWEVCVAIIVFGSEGVSPLFRRWMWSWG